MANRPRVVRSAARRRTGWSRGPGGNLQFTGVASAAYASISTANEDGLTLVRMRGLFRAWSSSVDSVTARMIGAVGIANFSENAVGVGITALETPIGDADWDGWIWHQFFDVGGLVNEGSGVYESVIDSKAMRKVHEGDSLVAIIQIETESGATVLQTSINTRVLDKLP